MKTEIFINLFYFILFYFQDCISASFRLNISDCGSLNVLSVIGSWPPTSTCPPAAQCPTLSAKQVIFKAISSNR